VTETLSLEPILKDSFEAVPFDFPFNVQPQNGQVLLSVAFSVSVSLVPTFTLYEQLALAHVLFIELTFTLPHWVPVFVIDTVSFPGANTLADAGAADETAMNVNAARSVRVALRNVFMFRCLQLFFVRDRSQLRDDFTGPL
jgi:hypothetical protein